MYTVSASPHIHSRQGVNRIMYDVIIALMPALVVSIIFFGLSALFITLLSVFSCVVIEFCIHKFLFKRTDFSVKDGSAVITGMLLAFNVPSSVPWWMIIIGSVVAIGIAKMSFGGIGNNIFNPALIGRVFLLISFPVEMTQWPTNSFNAVDGITGPTPLALLKDGIMSGKNILQIKGLPEYQDMFFGNIGGSLGEISALAIIIGGIYLLVRKVITWHIPIIVLVSMFVFSGIFYLANPYMYINPLFHLLSGGAMLGAWFMATDMATSPMTIKGQIIFAIGIGVITMVIRMFGAYPEGISFAILLMNALVPLLNKISPERYGNNLKKK
ncbi:MAG: Electron transport complex protein RnfD [Bacteroidetes bacterium ADurb.Bin217]|nr:MAG: Electron transport complex protein RnfD [Bacteroidetes bacterium ADurb.Bin217]HOS83880.1 RnfABCDGE type electron transport complex subunit D [Bacteroidales bacterium]